jgi:hypothetical protein
MNQFEPNKPPIENKKHPSEMLKDMLRVQSEEINTKVRSERLSGDLLTEDASLDPAGYGDTYTAAELEADAEKVRKLEVEWAEFYRGQPGVNTEDDMIRKMKEGKNRQKSGQMEMAVTALLSQMLGEDFIVVRTAAYDDYFNGVDNLIVNRVTKEVVGAFDEVHGSARAEEKKEKILRIAEKGGAQIRYGLGFKRKTIKREKLENIPVFYLGLEEEELAELVDGLEKNDMAKKDKIFRKLLASLQEQQQELKAKAKEIKLIVKLKSFGEALAEIEKK